MAVSESAGILDILLIGACEDNFRRARLFSSVTILKSGCWNYRKSNILKHSMVYRSTNVIFYLSYDVKITLKSHFCHKNVIILSLCA